MNVISALSLYDIVFHCLVSLSLVPCLTVEQEDNNLEKCT